MRRLLTFFLSILLLIPTALAAAEEAFPYQTSGWAREEVARAVELGGEGPVCALGTLYFSGDVRKAFEELVKG